MKDISKLLNDLNKSELSEAIKTTKDNPIIMVWRNEKSKGFAIEGLIGSLNLKQAIKKYDWEDSAKDILKRLEKDGKAGKRTKMPSGGSGVFIELTKTKKLSESTYTDDEDEYKYMEGLLKENIKILNKMFSNWSFDYEFSAGSFFWEHDITGTTVWATPFWEGTNGISIEVKDDMGDDYEPSKALPSVLAFKPTGNSNRDLKSYASLVYKNVLENIKPADQSDWAYWTELLTFNTNKIDRTIKKKFGKEWSFNKDSMLDSFWFENKQTGIYFYASPYYDDQNGLQISVTNDQGEQIDNYSRPLKTEKNEKKDLMNYLKLVSVELPNAQQKALMMGEENLDEETHPFAQLSADNPKMYKRLQEAAFNVAEAADEFQEIAKYMKKKKLNKDAIVEIQTLANLMKDEDSSQIMGLISFLAKVL